MAFLFKSKKSQERQLSSRDGTSGSQGSIQSASARIGDKAAAQRATPTGSLNSIDNDAITGSPEQMQARRGGSLDQIQPSDLAVSSLLNSILTAHRCIYATGR